MTKIYFYMAVLLAITELGLCSNNTISIDGYAIDTIGQSGKISLRRINGTGAIHISPDQLQELDASNKSIAYHTLNSFASVDFTYTADHNATRYNLSTTTIMFSSNLDNKKLTGTLTIEMLIFKEDGNITVESGEVFSVKKGALKFNIKLTGYTFCDGVNPCSAAGEFVDLTMEIKGKGDAEKAPEKKDKSKGRAGNSTANHPPETYELDSTGELTVSSLVRVDGVWKNMTDDYPKVEFKGKKVLFTFRFPKFTSEVYYDPIAQLVDDSTTTTTTTTTATTAAPTATASTTTTTTTTTTPSSSSILISSYTTALVFAVLALLKAWFS